MTDVYDKVKRSAVMSRIRSTGTQPELFVRRVLFASGFRYRLYDRKLPGKPDIVLAKWHTVIFVNGCFWHAHEGCRRASVPSTREDFWRAKLASNKERDKTNRDALRASGWRVLVVWECACRKRYEGKLALRMKAFIQAGSEMYLELGETDFNGDNLLIGSGQGDVSSESNRLEPAGAVSESM